MRVPYVNDEQLQASKDLTEVAIIERVRARRQPGELLPLDRALLNSPQVADGWNSFLGAIRQRTSLTADIRELAICRVALINGAEFEWSHHAPLAKEAGVDERGLRGEAENEWLTVKQNAVLRYTDEMTKDVRVSDDTFQNLRNYFSSKEIVELTATIGAYNCCSRFLVALDVGERNGLVNHEDWVY
ncbi:AhpD-like protein [Talaromyces proteolyticus]|uniref:AhpD-like protein n=1 Tax=Talaromyces proteolyticus TaxID=1131652 RepID=A0AAD4KZ90_9EURO|nr:AhpD-like protein [Talaromyces proteolyticus]KAH8702272.1 AhpD-like protein [Talaromyces proteolyticus]